MGVLSQLWERRTSLASDSVLSALLSRKVSVSGITVTEQTALQTAAVYQCAAILANNVGTLPLPVYERLEKGKRRATEHPLYRVLNRRAQPGDLLTRQRVDHCLGRPPSWHRPREGLW